ncbi:MAG: molybdate ABC transporter substrate-binding protein [Pseudomonadota bacterium]
MKRFAGWLVVLAAWLAPAAAAQTLHVAVASNFLSTARELVPRFEAASGHRVRLSSGSTGLLYAQLTAGAPFDVFLAADVERPARLERDGVALEGSRVTYALGQLVLWSTRPRYRGQDCLDALERQAYTHVAIANPEVAPYGAAARDVLERLGVRERVVLGANVAQALQFVASGNADLGLVARSGLRAAPLPPATCEWRVPAEWHRPIEQQAVTLKRAVDHPARRAFEAFLTGTEARRAIRAAGYALPPVERAEAGR